MPLTRNDLADWLAREHGVTVGDDDALFSVAILDSHAMVDLLALIEARTGRATGWADVSLQNMDSVARILAFANR